MTEDKIILKIRFEDSDLDNMLDFKEFIESHELDNIKLETISESKNNILGMEVILPILTLIFSPILIKSIKEIILKYLDIKKTVIEVKDGSSNRKISSSDKKVIADFLNQLK
jgi:hypothetical protein